MTIFILSFKLSKIFYAELKIGQGKSLTRMTSMAPTTRIEPGPPVFQEAEKMMSKVDCTISCVLPVTNVTTPWSTHSNCMKGLNNEIRCKLVTSKSTLVVGKINSAIIKDLRLSKLIQTPVPNV